MAETPPELIALLRRLADGRWHSGEALAADFGCSRAAIAKRLQRLQAELPLTLEASAGRGYRLGAALDLLDFAALRSALQAAFGALHLPWQIDSTNRLLAESAAGADPQCCIAELQSAGRGRRGRDWQAPLASGLTLSLSWGFSRPAAELGSLPLALGVAAARALQAEGLQGLALKWPNDLVVAASAAAPPRKLGGLLVEARGEMSGSFRVVAGLGLNVHAAPTVDGGLPAACLAEFGGRGWQRSRLAVVLALALRRALAEHEAAGFGPFAADFARLDCLRDRAVTVHAASPWQGTARGLASGGALRVERDDGRLEEVHAGDVSVRVG